MFNFRLCAHHRGIGQKRGLFYDGRMKTIQTYEEFWPYYLGEHDQAATRGWHYVGTGLADWGVDLCPRDSNMGLVAFGFGVWLFLCVG